MKDWYKSRTLWFNVISILLVIVAELAQLPDLAAYAPYFAAAVTIGNVILRTLTTQPLRLPGQETEPGTVAARRAP